MPTTNPQQSEPMEFEQ